MTTTIVAADETLNELVARAPETLAVLQRFGLDTCCGGALTLAVAAQHHDLALDDLLAALGAAMGERSVDVRAVAPR